MADVFLSYESGDCARVQPLASICGQWATAIAADAGLDIDDLGDLEKMPELRTHALLFADLVRIVADHRLLSASYARDALVKQDFAVERPESQHRARTTKSSDFHASHFDHTDVWTTGSVAFPEEGRPKARAA